MIQLPSQWGKFHNTSMNISAYQATLLVLLLGLISSLFLTVYAVFTSGFSPEAIIGSGGFLLSAIGLYTCQRRMTYASEVTIIVSVVLVILSIHEPFVRTHLSAVLLLPPALALVLLSSRWVIGVTIVELLFLFVQETAMLRSDPMAPVILILGTGCFILARFTSDTQHRQAEAALRISETHLRTVVTNTPVIIFEFDQQGTVTLAEGKGLAALGFAPETVIGKSIYDLAFDQPQFLHDIQRVLEGEKCRATTVINKLTYETTFTPIHDAQGHCTGAISVLADITSYQRLRDQLLHAQKMESIGRMSGGLAHDFNNLLTVIIGYLELSLSNISTDSLIADDLREARKAAERATRLTRQLLTFARKQTFTPEELNLNTLVHETEQLLRRVLSEDIQLIMRPGTDLQSIRADAGQIEQVLLNLAVNARDAMPDGGKLLIETSNVYLDDTYINEHLGVPAGDYVLLAVSDTGQGIAPEARQHLFEPFFTTKEPGKGTGLGLAICYGIIKQHGGAIWVYSEVGQGATFKIYLPRSSASLVRTVVAPVANRLLYGNETVLLVEDESQVRSIASRVLRTHGYTVLEASDGLDAQLVAERHGVDSIDLLLTDMILPNLNGYTLAEQLKPSHPGLKVLFTSGYTENVMSHQGCTTSATPFLSKPYSPAMLLLKVHEAIGR